VFFRGQYFLQTGLNLMLSAFIRSYPRPMRIVRI